MGINKYIVAYKNYKEIWIKIKKSRKLEPSSPLGSVKPKLVEKVRNFISKNVGGRNSPLIWKLQLASGCVSSRMTCNLAFCDVLMAFRRVVMVTFFFECRKSEKNQEGRTPSRSE